MFNSANEMSLHQLNVRINSIEKAITLITSYVATLQPHDLNPFVADELLGQITDISKSWERIVKQNS